MKLLTRLTILLAANGAAVADNDIGAELGLLGSYGIKGHYEIANNIEVRGFYNSLDISGIGCVLSVNSVGAAALYDAPIDKTLGWYAGAGLQNISMNEDCTSASFRLNGTVPYLVGGMRLNFNEQLSFRAEYNTFHALSLGAAFRF